jgi:hypothetical protein
MSSYGTQSQFEISNPSSDYYNHRVNQAHSLPKQLTTTQLCCLSMIGHSDQTMLIQLADLEKYENN